MDENNEIYVLFIMVFKLPVELRINVASYLDHRYATVLDLLNLPVSSTIRLVDTSIVEVERREREVTSREREVERRDFEVGRRERQLQTRLGVAERLQDKMHDHLTRLGRINENTRDRCKFTDEYVRDIRDEIILDKDNRKRRLFIRRLKKLDYVDSD